MSYLPVTHFRSTHNTCIERLWVEVGLRFARPWDGFFYCLERIHLLDHHNPHHLWLLHHLFLHEISASCAKFCDEWNTHPISREEHNQSPNVSAVTIFNQHVFITNKHCRRWDLLNTWNMVLISRTCYLSILMCLQTIMALALPWASPAVSNWDQLKWAE